MNWLAFVLVTYLVLALEVGLRTLLMVGGVSPSFLLVLLVVVGLQASPLTTGFVALLLGALADLTAHGVPGGAVLGPNVLGFLLGGYALVHLRGLLFRESVVTLAIMTLTAGALVQLLVVALLLLRQWWFRHTVEAIPHWSTADQLFTRFWLLLYSAVLSVPLGWLLLRLRSFLGLDRIERVY